jgi:hypothetical protein
VFYHLSYTLSPFVFVLILRQDLITTFACTGLKLEILLPSLPEYLGLQIWATMPGLLFCFEMGVSLSSQGLSWNLLCTPASAS